MLKISALSKITPRRYRRGNTVGDFSLKSTNSSKIQTLLGDFLIFQEFGQNYRRIYFRQIFNGRPSVKIFALRLVGFFLLIKLTQFEL
jgi:hypothetical protein